MIKLRFYNISQKSEKNREFGPFEWVQLTYNLMRVDDDIEIAALVNGVWLLYGEEESFSDVVIESVE